MLRSFRAWLRTRNAAIDARRTADAERTKGPAELRRAVCGRASHGVVRCLNCGRDLCVQHKDVVDGFHAADWLMAKPLVCLEPLSDDDRALIDLGGPETVRPGDRFVLASGRFITGWELAQLTPTITLEVEGDLDELMMEELPDPEFRRAYTAIPSGRGLSLAVEDQTSDDLYACTCPTNNRYHRVPRGHHVLCRALKRPHAWDDRCDMDSTWGHDDAKPDDLVALAAGVDVNPVPTYPEPICRHQWPVAPEGGATHTVPHVCVRLDQHRRHKCACGAWGLEIGVRT